MCSFIHYTTFSITKSAGEPRVVVQREQGKKPLVAQFGGIPLKRKQDAVLVDHTPQFLMTNRSELLQRVLADQCELCGSRERVEVHHTRKLADARETREKRKTCLGETNGSTTAQNPCGLSKVP